MRSRDIERLAAAAQHAQRDLRGRAVMRLAKQFAAVDPAPAPYRRPTAFELSDHVGTKDPGVAVVKPVRALPRNANLGQRLLSFPNLYILSIRNRTLVWQTESLMANLFRYAMCNEAFEGQPFAEVCRLLQPPWL